MTDDRLEAAVRLREAGELEAARAALIELVAERPDDAVVNYQAAWAHDASGLETEAVPFYERALELGLSDDDLRGALLGLGSTYRTIGRYEDAERTLREGRGRFGPHGAFDAFLAMALYNLGRHAEALELLLRALAETSSDDSVQRYRRAIGFYATNLDEVFTQEDEVTNRTVRRTTLSTSSRTTRPRRSARTGSTGRFSPTASPSRRSSPSRPGRPARRRRCLRRRESTSATASPATNDTKFNRWLGGRLRRLSARRFRLPVVLELPLVLPRALEQHGRGPAHGRLSRRSRLVPSSEPLRHDTSSRRLRLLRPGRQDACRTGDCGVDPSTIRTIGGNTGGSLAGSYFNGDGVYEKTVKRSSPSIAGFGRPAYGTAGGVPGGGGTGTSVTPMTSIRSIRQQQQAVNALGHAPKLDVDGEWGPKTLAGVKWLQRKVGATPVDGEWGPTTEARYVAHTT